MTADPFAIITNLVIIAVGLLACMALTLFYACYKLSQIDLKLSEIELSTTAKALGIKPKALQKFRREREETVD